MFKLKKVKFENEFTISIPIDALSSIENENVGCIKIPGQENTEILIGCFPFKKNFKNFKEKLELMENALEIFFGKCVFKNFQQRFPIEITKTLFPDWARFFSCSEFTPKRFWLAMICSVNQSCFFYLVHWNGPEKMKTEINTVFDSFQPLGKDLHE